MDEGRPILKLLILVMIIRILILVLILITTKLLLIIKILSRAPDDGGLPRARHGRPVLGALALALLLLNGATKAEKGSM